MDVSVIIFHKGYFVSELNTVKDFRQVKYNIIQQITDNR